jgi:hypothetical protein
MKRNLTKCKKSRLGSTSFPSALWEADANRQAALSRAAVPDRPCPSPTPEAVAEPVPMRVNDHATALVALLFVHLPKGYAAGGGGYEYVLLIGATCFVIAIRGGGPYSVDRAIGKEL